MKKLVVVGLLVFIFLYFGGSSFINGFCFGDKGDGNIIKVERSLEDFNSIAASNGLIVNLIQADKPSATISYDSNLIEKVVTNIDNNGELIIKYDNNSCGSTEAIVDVYFTNIDRLSASAGVEVNTNDTLKSENLTIKVSSGSIIELISNTEKLSIDVSSGGEITHYGIANFGDFSVSSGGLIDGESLVVQSVQASASSGGEVSINGIKDLNLTVSSGGLIEYQTDSATVSKSASSGGEISRF